MAGIDLDLVRHALETARKRQFAEVEVAVEDASFRATLEPESRRKPRLPAPQKPETQAPPLEDVVLLRSPIVGYYRRATPPLEQGAEIQEGAVVAIVDALGIANDVAAPASGRVVEVLVADGQGVEFGQVLAKVKP